MQLYTTLIYFLYRHDLSKACQLIGRPVLTSSGNSHYYKAMVKGTVFFSKQYKRVKKRNSYTVSYVNEDGHIAYGQIMYFVHWKETGCCSAIINPLGISKECPSPTMLKCGNLLRVDKLNATISVPISSLTSKCLFINIDRYMYVAKFPNFLHYD